MNITLDVKDKYLNNVRVTIFDSYSLDKSTYYNTQDYKERDTYILKLDSKIYYINKDQYDYIKKEKGL